MRQPVPAARPTAVRGLPAAVAALSMLVATACGSTVSQPVAGGPVAADGSGLSADSAGGGLGASLGEGVAPAGDTTGADGGVPAAPGAGAADGPASSGVVGQGGTAGSAAGGTGSGGQVAPAAASARAPGVTDSEIRIGITIADDAGKANAALGAGAVTQGDVSRSYQVVAAAVNRAGGILGRKIVIEEFHYDITSGGTADAVEQSACEYFTKDRPVFAIVGSSGSDISKQCTARAGMLLLGSSLSNSDEKTFRDWPLYLEPTAISLTRQARLYAKGLKDMGFFDRTSKLGLVTVDSSSFTRAASVLDAELQRYGQRIAERQYVAPGQRQSDLGNQGAQISSAVLRFRQQGIDRVLFLDGSGTLTLLFMNNAESQKYRPRYGLLTQSAFGVLRSAGVPKEQLVESRAIGWFPRIDGTRSTDFIAPPGEAACLRIYREAGMAFDSTNAHRKAMDVCDYFEFLKLALTDAGEPVAASRVAAAAGGIGNRLRPAASHAVALSPTRHDGTSAVRYLAFDEPCDCYRYISGVVPAA